MVLVSTLSSGNGRSYVGDAMIVSELGGGHALGFAPEREPTFASPLLVTVLVYCMYVVGPTVGTPGIGRPVQVCKLDL